MARIPSTYILKIDQETTPPRRADIEYCASGRILYRSCIILPAACDNVRRRRLRPGFDLSLAHRCATVAAVYCLLRTGFGCLHAIELCKDFLCDRFFFPMDRPDNFMNTNFPLL